MKKIILISLLIIASLLMLSCSEESKDPEVSSDVTKQLSEYSIVYPDCMGAYSELFSIERYSAIRLCSMIEERYNITLDTHSDAEKATGKEILIGNARNTAASDTEGYNITKKDKSISINADGIFPYSCAFKALLSEIEKECAVPEKLDISEESVDMMDKEKDFVYIITDEESRKVSEYAVKKLTLLGKDISEYKIIYHEWGTPANPHFGLNEKYAAEQLQRYIKLATGIELRVETDDCEPTEREIVVGITNREGDVIESIDREGFGEETVIIKTEGTRLIISGSQRRGTIYAAYSFLEDHLGIRFFTEDCEIIYKTDSIDISEISYKYTPDLEFRDSNQKSMLISEYASKRRINSNFRRVMNYKQGGNYTLTSEFPHTMGTLLDLDNAPGFAQPCFTDEETYQKALAKVRQLIERTPNCDAVSVTQNDDARYCPCSSCSKIIKEESSTTAPLMRFINRLADDIKADFPDVKILTFAYMFSLEPPKTAPRDNVIIMYCPIDSCCACALNDPNCQTNKRFARALEGWCDMTDNVYLWYYVAEYTRNDVLPFMNFDAIFDNYEYFRSLGVKGIFNQGWMDNAGNEFDVMRAYLLSRLMWDPDMTREEYKGAMYEFIDAYYGEASEVIKEYIYAMEFAAESKHFTQYATAYQALDVSTVKELCAETDLWWESLGSYDYSSEKTKDRISLLFEGYRKTKDYIY